VNLPQEVVILAKKNSNTSLDKGLRRGREAI
jgi:hypothetical protein